MVASYRARFARAGPRCAIGGDAGYRPRVRTNSFRGHRLCSAEKVSESPFGRKCTKRAGATLSRKPLLSNESQTSRRRDFNTPPSCVLDNDVGAVLPSLPRLRDRLPANESLPRTEIGGHPSNSLVSRPSRYCAHRARQRAPKGRKEMSSATTRSNEICSTRSAPTKAGQPRRKSATRPSAAKASVRKTHPQKPRIRRSNSRVAYSAVTSQTGERSCAIAVPDYFCGAILLTKIASPRGDFRTSRRGRRLPVTRR